MNKTKSKAHTAVDRIAQRLRSLALSIPSGEYIGSEQGLAQQFGVTGPTLRQAIRLLEHEELVKVKRGVGGGYFAHRPDLETISRVAAVYIRGNLKSLEEIREVAEYVQPLLVDCIMKSNRLNELEVYADPQSASSSHDDFMEKQIQFNDLLWDLADNVPIRLIYSIFFEFGRGIELDQTAELTPIIRDFDKQRIDLARALLDGNREAAIPLAVARCRAVHAGLKANLERTRESKA